MSDGPFLRQRPKSRMWPLVLLIFAAIFGICAGLTLIITNASDPYAGPIGVEPSPTPPRRGVPDSGSRPVAKASPQQAAKPMIHEGIWHVGEDVPAGTYRTVDPVEPNQCYWSKSRDGEGTDIIANDLPSGGHPQVTLRKGQWFKTEDCGSWAKK